MISASIKPRLGALLALLVALAAGGCGEEASAPAALIPQEESDKLVELLDDAEQQYDEGACEELGLTIGQLENRVTEKTAQQDVDPAVIETLTASLARLDRLSTTCEPPPTVTETVPPPTTAPPAPPTTVPTEAPPTTTEETKPETTEPETTEEEKKEKPPKKPEPEEPPDGGPPPEPPGQEEGD